MSFAQHDIVDATAAQVIPFQGRKQAALVQVLVVARTPAIGHAMASEMAQDAGVAGFVIQSTLAEVVQSGTQDWAAVKCVAFEISQDRNSDLHALSQLIAQCEGALQFVAMTDAALSPEMTQTYKAAGVQEMLYVGPKEAAQAANSAPVAWTDPEQATVAAPVKGAGANGKITVVLRARGGAGGSTLAVNLAVAQAERGAGKTALVDLDIQNGAISLMLDLPESPEATNLITGAVAADDAFLDTAMVRHASGIDVLTSPDVFAPLTALKPACVAALLDALQARYDTVILDMPQGVVDWIEPVFGHAARVLLVSDTSLPSVKRTRRLIDLIADEHMTLPVDVVINQHKKPLVMSATHKEIELLFGRPLNHWIPLDAKAARRATDMGHPLQTHAKRSPATRAIAALAADLFSPKQEG